MKTLILFLVLAAVVQAVYFRLKTGAWTVDSAAVAQYRKSRSIAR
jgi:hypothetical protein